MAINDIKISELTVLNAGEETGAELFPIIQGTSNFSYSLDNMKTYIRFKPSGLPALTTPDSNTNFVVSSGGDKLLSMDNLVSYLDSHITFPPTNIVVDKRNDILDIGETWEEVGSVTIDVDSGWVEYGLSTSYTFGDTNDSAEIRFSTDGGNTWNTFIRESKDPSDVEPWVYMFPEEVTAGTLTLLVEAQKTVGGNTFDILFIDTWIKEI